MNQRVFITGSTSGLGLLTAQQLIADGYQVYLHARNHDRATMVHSKCPQAAGIMIGDLSNVDDLKRIAMEVNKLGRLTSIIHNAGVYTSNQRLTFQVNVLAPYVLTALINPPERMIYTASNMHAGAPLEIQQLHGQMNYSTSKLAVLLLMKKVARLDRQTVVSAVDPGWVPTKMGGKNAPDRLEDGYQTQVWLTEKRDAGPTAQYYYHQHLQSYDQRVDSLMLQDQLTNYLEGLTRVDIPTDE